METSATTITTTTLPLNTNLSWKEQKEAFMMGFEGTLPWKLLWICSMVPVGWAFYQEVILVVTTGTAIDAVTVSEMKANANGHHFMVGS